MELASEAIAFAVRAHDGMRRKKSQAPYILHPMEAAVIVGTMTDDQNLIAAAALHDVVEEQALPLKRLKKNSELESGSLLHPKLRINLQICRLRIRGVFVRRSHFRF